MEVVMKKSLWLTSALALAGFVQTGSAQEPKVMPAPAAPAVTATPIILSTNGCGSSCCVTDCCMDDCGRSGFYAAVRLGAIWQNRSTRFAYGQVALDSNDDDNPGFALSTPTYNINGDAAFIPELVGGMHFGPNLSVEGRFAYARWDADGSLAFDGGGNADPNFWVPFLDARTAPIQNGIAGIRLVIANANLSYSSTYYDWGFDLVGHVYDSDTVQVDAVFGPAFASINQTYDFNVAGSRANPNQTRDAVTHENINENFYGAKLGVVARGRLTSRLSLETAASVFLYGRHVNLAGVQRMTSVNSGTTQFDITNGVGESDDTFVPRLDLRVGARYQASENLAVSLTYNLGGWFNVATIDNPELLLLPIDGDNRWVGAHPARLAEENLTTNAVMLGVEWRR